MRIGWMNVLTGLAMLFAAILLVLALVTFFETRDTTRQEELRVTRSAR